MTLSSSDPWLRHLWGLRGTYAGTLIDFEARREELEKMFAEPSCAPTLGAEEGKHGSCLVRPKPNPQP